MSRSLAVLWQQAGLQQQDCLDTMLTFCSAVHAVRAMHAVCAVRQRQAQRQQSRQLRRQLHSRFLPEFKVEGILSMVYRYAMLCVRLKLPFRYESVQLPTAVGQQRSQGD